jgi:hypothetical protein
MAGEQPKQDERNETAQPRPAWTTPELVELSIWSSTGVKGSPASESDTSKVPS